MKKKFNIKNTFALVAVIVIWGYVMKTKFGFFNSDSDDTIVSVQESYFLPKKYTKDTFQLELAIRDPFLGGKKFVQSNSYSANQPSNVTGNRGVVQKPRQNLQLLKFKFRITFLTCFIIKFVKM